jgi:hypothetical protein
VAKRSKTEVPARLIQIVRDPIYKRFIAALRAYERAIDKRSKDQLELSQVHKAREKALDAYNWLRALDLSPAELEQEHARIGAVGQQLAAAEVAAAAVRHAARRAQRDELGELERVDPHTRYVPGIGYVRGRRVIDQ